MKSNQSCEHCSVVDGKPKFKRTEFVAVPGDWEVSIDYCIHRIVAALNAGGVPTRVSCCGHGVRYGHIGLMDGRLLVIHPDMPRSMEEWNELNREGRLRRIHHV